MSDDISGSERVSQIRNELARLFTEQTEFFRKGARGKHTESELAEYDKRRERIRRLFGELDELRKRRETSRPSLERK
jgi:hypothetical protein